MATSPELLDSQWLEALRAGDETALRNIFDRHYPLLLSDIYRYIQDKDTCKDLAQEIFVELWRKKNTLVIHTSLRAYLRRAAINRALNFIKTNRRTQLGDTDDWQDHPDMSQYEINRKNDQDTLEQTLHNAIQQLPEKCRLVFSLSRFEQLSHKEIAQKLGISVKTIENQITKAMRLLREAMLKHPNLSSAVIWAANWWLAG